MTSTEPIPLRIAYGPHPGQFGDLYLPARSSPALPVAVVLHGGWWKDNQTLDSYPTHALVSWLAKRGNVAVWNLEYRRMQATGDNTQAPWPITLADVATGIDLLDEISAVNPERIVVFGHSAGAHLAAWAACRIALPAESPLWRERPVVPRGVGLVAGVLSLDRSGDLEQPVQVTRLLGGAPEAMPERLRQTCPSILSRGLRLQGFCLHGDVDQVVSLDQARMFIEAAGTGISLHRLHGGTHFSMLPGENMISEHWRTLTQLVSNMVNEVCS